MTGWGIGPRERSIERGDAQDADDLYRILDQIVLPLFHSDQRGWAEVMRSTIALNACFFNTHRTLEEYLVTAYREQHRFHEG